MSSFEKIAVSLLVIIVVGLLLLAGGSPQKNIHFYNKTDVVCVTEKGWGFKQTRNYCMKTEAIK